MSEQKIIEKIVQANHGTYVIFFVYGCPYCEKALSLLRSSHVLYKGYNINEIDGGMKNLLIVLDKHKDQLNFDSSHKTKPIIFYNGKFIGGFSELSKILNI